MSKIKKALGLTSLGVASLSLLFGIGFVSYQQELPNSSVSALDTKAETHNSAPEFFNAVVKNAQNTKLDLKNSPLVLSTAGDYIDFSFATEQKDDNGSYYIYDQDSDNSGSWKCFNFTNFSIKKNGESISFTTSDTTLFISTQTREQFAEGRITQAFDLHVKLDTTSQNNSLSEKMLTLKDEGLYEITIPYTMYVTNDNGLNFDDVIEDSVTFSFMLFNHSTYLSSGTERPVVSASEFKVRTDNSTGYLNYFYNFDSSNLPYIEYDITKYNLSLKRDYNLSTEEYEIVFDNSSDDFISSYENIEFFDILRSGNTAKIFFADIGDYTLDFEMKYSFENGDNFLTYMLPKNLDMQKLYVFGYQSTYTKYDSATNTNTYPEFKEIDKETHSILQSADVTRLVDTPDGFLASNTYDSLTLNENITPVKTNQVPVKFSEYATASQGASGANGKLYKATKDDEAQNKFNLESGVEITASKNVSDPGTYLAIFTYTFNNYLDQSGLQAPSTTFTQLFLFEITNEVPSIEVFDGEQREIQLSSGGYTNKNVYIKSIYEESPFNSDVRIEIECYDYVRGYQKNTRNLSEFTKTDDGYYKITENGNYTINLFFGRNQSTPIVRKFNIDNTQISNIQAYGVKQNSSGTYYSQTREIENITNEPLVFTWDSVKQSGARTYAYCKFYPITTASDMGLNNQTFLFQCAGNKLSPVNYRLNLDQNPAPAWIYYPNAEDVVDSSAINSTYVKSAQGLYIIDIFDEAGNNASKVYLLDQTSPNFILEEFDQNGAPTYSIPAKTITLSKDAKLYWGENKIISVTNADENLIINKDRIESPNIQAEYNNFAQNIKNFSNLGSDFNGKYLEIPINSKYYLKDLGVDDYSEKQASSLEIISSFKLLYKEEAQDIYRYFFSTSVDSQYVEVSAEDLDNIKAGRISALDVRKTNTADYIYDTLTEYDNLDGNNYESIYSVEGSFVALIRDSSNTKVSSSEKQTYLNYPSSYQMITLTSDDSRLEVGYKNDENNVTSLKLADSASFISPDRTTKSAFYQPTAKNEKLYVSFKPKVVSGDKITQVESVVVEFYPFENQVSTSFKSGEGLVATIYRNLSAQPQFTQTIYSFDENEQEIERVIELNIVNNVTAEGKYVITRTYKTGDNFFVNDYDFAERKLTLIVDRNNVISDPEVVSADVKDFTFTISTTTYNAQVLGNTLILSNQLPDGYFITINGDKTSNQAIINKESSASRNSGNFYYVLQNKIESFNVYDSFENPINVTTNATTSIPTTQSVVGSGIFVNVFDSSVDFKEYPNYKFKNDGDIALVNSGKTLYTRKLGLDKEGVAITETNPVFSTNKVPFNIYIPEFKYSYGHSYINDDFSFETSENESLSYFRDDIVMSFYQLYAEVFKDDKLVATSSGSRSGYLKFVSNNQEVTNFTETGTYKVVVYQAYNDAATGDDTFKNAYTFSFNVTETAPSFDLFNADGKSLKNDTSGIFYTNSNKIVTTWEDSTSEYDVNIDKTKVHIKVKKGNNFIVDEDIDLLDNAHDWIEYNNNRLEIDVNQLDLTSKDFVQITMSFDVPQEFTENYTSTTKTIYIDRSSFDETGNYKSTADELFSGLNLGLSIDDFRNYYTYNNVKVLDKDKTNASFSSSKSTGLYRYYNYIVDSTFVGKLIDKINTNKEINKYGITSVYYRELGTNVYSTNFEETLYNNFYETNTTTFKKLSEDENFVAGNYYEIIESDYAGNLNIYVVYVKANNPHALTFNTNNYISDAEITSNLYNIFGSTNLTLNNISLFGDKWAFVKLQTTSPSTETNFVISPYLSEGMVRNASTNKDVALADILNNVSNLNKAKLVIMNRQNGNSYTIYINRANTSPVQTEKFGNKGGIRIALPSGNVQTESLVRVYPIEIQIQTKYGEDNYSEPKTYQNNPNNNLTNGYSYQTNWETLSDEFATFSYSNDGYLYIEFTDELTKDTKVKYTIIDNFNKATSVIQIVDSNFTDGYEGKYYTSADADGKMYFRTDTSFSYIFNKNIYQVEVWHNGEKVNYPQTNYDITGIIKELKFSCNGQTDEKYEIKVFDADLSAEELDGAEPLKLEYIHLYNALPSLNGNLNKVTFIDENGENLYTNNKFTGSGTFRFDDKAYSYTSATTFATIINIRYPKSTGQFAYQGYILKEGDEEFIELPTSHRIEQNGVYYILFKYTSSEVFTSEYILYRIEILDSSTNFFYVAVDGSRINPDSSYFTDNNGKQYSNYYIVNVPYSERSRVSIETNEYQQVRILQEDHENIVQSQDVVTIIKTLTNKINGDYPTGVSPYTDYVAISYIPRTSRPASNIFYLKETGETETLLGKNNVTIVSELESDFDTLKISWSSYYGIEQNVVEVSITKDGNKINLPVYKEGSTNYINLKISGSYRFVFKDRSGNIQSFGTKDYLDLIFLKDVHFTMTTLDQSGNEVETEAIDKGVFNKIVKLNLKNISTYYASTSIGTGSNIIIVKRNGKEYTGYSYTNSTFTFNEVGFYEIYFSATTLGGKQVREQKYSFTIVNPNESRYAFEYSPFSTYKIEKVVRDDGVNIIEKANLVGAESFYVNEQEDGSAKWTITINTNQKLTPGSDEFTRFTFSLLIRANVPPVIVSIKDGDATTKDITITFNAENIYNSVGDCVLSVGGLFYEINEDTIAEIGTKTITITKAGTYFVQVHTDSGNLLYSYKVVKNDPLNGWAIAAIVIGSVVGVAILVIVFLLRKRIRVK